MEQVSLALRERICRIGGRPDITADVLTALDASRRAHRRWQARPAPRAQPFAALAESAMALRDVPQMVAPFCHDVLLYRAFIGPAYAASACDWMGPAMWRLVESLGGWRRVHTMALSRLADEAMVAREQAPSFLRPPSYGLRAMNMRELWELTRPWARKYPALGDLDHGEMAQHALTAGAWLWVMDRTDADVRRRGADADACLPERVMRLAERVDQAVGIARERR